MIMRNNLRVIVAAMLFGAVISSHSNAVEISLSPQTLMELENVVGSAYNPEAVRIQAETYANAAIQIFTSLGQGVSAASSTVFEEVHDYRTWVKIGMFPVGIVLGGAVAQFGTQFVFNQIARKLNKNIPELVSETSRKTVFNTPLQMMKNLIWRKTPALLSDIVLSPENENRMHQLAESIKMTSRLNLPYENLGFFGPPGTGKTEFAKLLARYSDMDYAILSADKFKQFSAPKAIQEMKKLFAWARKGSRGTILFFDECDGVFLDRNSLGEEGRALVNACLFETGTLSDKFMMIFASNHPQKLDRAIRERISNSYIFDLPSADDRLKILKKKIEKEISGRKFIVIKNGKKNRECLSFETGLDDTYLKSVADKIEGFSGRTITQMIEAIRKTACLQGGCITRTIFDNEVAEKIKKSAFDKQINLVQEQGLPGTV